MRLCTILTVGVCVTLAGLTPATAREPKEPAAPVSALVVFEGIIPRSQVAKVTAVYVADPKKLVELEAFFPNYRKRPSSRLFGAWEAGHRVYFNLRGGETVRVTVSLNGDGDTWSAGRGDQATRGKFVPFAKELLKAPSAGKLD